MRSPWSSAQLMTRGVVAVEKRSFWRRRGRNAPPRRAGALPLVPFRALTHIFAHTSSRPRKKPAKIATLSLAVDGSLDGVTLWMMHRVLGDLQLADLTSPSNRRNTTTEAATSPCSGASFAHAAGSAVKLLT